MKLQRPSSFLGIIFMSVIAVLFSFMLIVPHAVEAASMGPKNPTAAANDPSVGTVSWSNTGNAYTSNNVYATVPLSLNQVSNYLVISGLNFAIPAATINGIVASVERKEGTAYYMGIKDSSVKLVKNGAIAGTEHASSALWSSTEAVVNYGSSTDLWGTTWTPGDINAPNFGLAIAVQGTGRSGTETASIDTVTITVYYTPVGGCVPSAATIILNPSSQTISTEGGSVGYTVTITNNDTGACADETFNLTRTDSGDTTRMISSILPASVILPAGGSTSVPVLTVTEISTETTGSLTSYVTATGTTHAAVNSNNVITTLGIATCVRNAPTMTLAPASQTISIEGGSTIYALTVTNNDSAICASETFNLSKSDSNTTNFNASTLSSPNVTLAPGASSSGLTLTVNAKTGQASGTNVSSVTAASANHANKTSNNVTTTLAACLVRTPTLTLSPASQDITSDGGYVDYTFSITNNDSVNCPSATFNLSAIDSNSANFTTPSTVTPNSLTIAQGAGANVTVRVTAAAGKTSGTNNTYVRSQRQGQAHSDSSNTVATTIIITPPVCNRLAPTVTLSPASQTITTDGGSTVYTLLVKNNDNGAACTDETFNLTANDSDTAPGTNFDTLSTLSAPSVVLASGATSAPISLTVKAKVGRTSGTNTSSVTAASANHANKTSNNVITTLDVAVCTQKTPILIVTPTARAITPGGSVEYQVKVKNADTGPCGNSTFTLAFSDIDSPNGSFKPSSLDTTPFALAPGVTATRSLTVSSENTAANGNFNDTTVSLTVTGHASPANVVVKTTVAPVSPLMHNSVNAGTCSNTAYTSQSACVANGGTWTTSQKWLADGGWGLAGTKYGEFTCATCHTPGNTANIKRIKATITSPNSPTHDFPGNAVSFLNTTQFGDDTGGHTTSNRVCEVCHSQTNYHRYDTTGQTVFNHNNNTDCVTCHTHKTAFKASCESCHGNPPTDASLANNPWPTGSITAGSHAKHVTDLGFSCDNCHSNSNGNMPQESVVYPGFGDISIGFNYLGGMTSGTYSGQLNVSYNQVAGAGGLTCSAIYCHGSTLSGGSNTTPTWGGSAPCGSCHAVTNLTQTSGSHAAHLTALRGPNGVTNTTVTCDTCHGAGGASGTHAGHVDGAISFADGNPLSTTSVCNPCHSSGGPFDGVTDAAIGAKNNWQNGVYTGNTLTAGKERWCVTCHDSGTSVIGGRQAPDVAGNNTTYGYYSSGHGSKATECSGCHDLSLNHNFDNMRTYASASNNYKAGYRLKSVGGQNPMAIPKTYAFGEGCNYDPGDFRLCFSCHSESALISDTQPDGVYECTTNPFKNAASFSTGFRNVSSSGANGGWAEVHANIHWDHLVDVQTIFWASFWDSDYNGSDDSKVTCLTCHNVHGAQLIDTSGPTIRMTKPELDIQWGSDATGTYGKDGPNSNFPCFNCHGGGSEGRYYKTAVPELMLSGAVVLQDINSNDPAPAESGYANNQTVQVTLYAWGFPTEMILAENAAFTVNSTGWIPFAKTSSYTLTNSDGSKNVYAKVRNALGESASKYGTITLDRTSPTVPANALLSPNGGEVWDQGSSHAITWSGVSDTYLKASPITLKYSTDSGSTYPNTIATGLANSGTYTWNPLPMINSTTVRVQLTATDRAGNQSSDVSNANFTIQALTPGVSSFTVSDSNSSDPAPAEVGYTNGRTLNVSISATNFPTEMILAEDSGFTQNSTGWVAYSASSTYTLSNSDGAKTVYLKLRNAAGESGASSFAITLDRIAPTITTSTLTAPNGAEQWSAGDTTRQITWTAGDITDTNLKASPVTLTYSVDAGSTYPYTIAGNIANSGSYSWNPIPKPESYQALVKVTATDRAGNQASDGSNASFIIKPLYIVTNTNDTGAGSLRQAMTDLIAAGGNDSIWFDIPVGSLTNGVGVIGLNAVLPTITAPGITIDGGSQTVLRGDTNPRGPEIRLHGNTYSFNGITSSADNTTIRGMQFTNFYTYGIYISAGSNAVIEGNHIGFWSDSVTNYTGRANDYGLYLSGSNHRIGGTSSDASNYIGGNTRNGMYISASGLSILNNSIGLLPDGADMPNGATYEPIYLNANNTLVQGNRIAGGSSTAGIRVAGSNVTIKGNTFGLHYNGTTWSARNAPQYAIYTLSVSISNLVVGGPNVATSDAILNDSNIIASSVYGIYVYHNNSNPTKIYGNFIGTNPGRTQTFLGSTGIYLGGNNGRNAIIGGSGAGEAGNVIAHMTTRGVHVFTGANGTRISRNSFFDNGTEAAASDDAIYLAAGANNDITRPVISAASTSSVTVDGVQSGDVVEVYISDYDGSGTEYGEGKTFIGSAAAGGTSVAVPVSGVSMGQWVTATRTSASDTSAFSANVQVQ